MKSKLKLAVLTGAIAAGFAMSANAANLSFTLTPSAANPALSANPGTLTADTMQGVINSVITISNTGGVYSGTETGTYIVTSFTNNGNPLTGGALAGYNSDWLMYYTFTATTTGNVFLANNQPLTSFDFTLYGDAGANATFGPTGTVNANGDTQVTLATGTLNYGVVGLSGPPFNPSITVNDSFIIAAGQGSGAGTFFTAPNPFYINLGASATGQANQNISSDCPATGPADGASCQISIVGGAATAGFNVPEPGTIALLGLGLVGLGFARRKLS